MLTLCQDSALCFETWPWTKQVKTAALRGFKFSHGETNNKQVNGQNAQIVQWREKQERLDVLGREVQF